MTKVISISDKAYELLSKLKKDSSFSEIVIEICTEKIKSDILKVAGSWTDEDAEKIMKTIYEERKMPSRRFS